MSSESDFSNESQSSPAELAQPKKKSASPPAKQEAVGNGKLPKNWVQCPCCQKNFPMAIFNDHLDG